MSPSQNLTILGYDIYMVITYIATNLRDLTQEKKMKVHWLQCTREPMKCMQLPE
jgi:hypothetical protein